MQQRTRREYCQIAEKLLSDYEIQDMDDFDKISETFRDLAAHVTKSYWYRKRRALEVWLQTAGMNIIADQVNSIQYPFNKKETPVEYSLARSRRRKQRKTVSQYEHLMLIEYCERKKDKALTYALLMAWLLGCCRPIELTTLTILPNNRIQVKGAKKTADGQRGLDRVLEIEPHVISLVEEWLKQFELEKNKDNCDPGRAMKRLQRRLENATKALWPERKNQITLYTYRHQTGSDMKGADMCRIQAAAMMGHQSVDSLNAYGNARHAYRAPNIRASDASSRAVRNRTLSTIPSHLHKKNVSTIP